MAALFAIAVVMGFLLWLLQRRGARSIRHGQSRSRADRQRRRVLHWNFVARLFDKGPLRLTHHKPDDDAV